MIYAGILTRFDDEHWLPATDTRMNKTAQTVDPTSLVWPDSYTLGLPNYDVVRFPWLHGQHRMNDIYYNNIISATGENYPISAGVCLAEIEDGGVITTSLMASANGVAMFAHQEDPPSSWGTPSAHAANIEYFNCQVGVATKIEFECKKHDSIWFIYYPSNNSDMATVSFGDILLTTE